MVRAAQRTVRASTKRKADGVLAKTLREDVSDALEQLSQRLVAHTARGVTAADPDPAAPGLKQVQETVRFLGQVVAAWADIPDNAVPSSGAGFGSTVVAEDLDHGDRETFTLMAGAMLDLDAGQVSLASPIGQALLGAVEHEVVSVQTPQRLRRLRVLQIKTLQDRIAEGRVIHSA
jgi:transcription elongation GreA/GreB family factor